MGTKISIELQNFQNIFHWTLFNDQNVCMFLIENHIFLKIVHILLILYVKI